MPDDIMLEPAYDTVDAIPEAFRPLYVETGGKHLLTKIKGLASTADVTRVQRALDAEKKEHGTLKTNWTGFFGDKKPEEVRAILDRVPELETIAASKNINDEKLNELAETRFRAKLAPMERDNATMKTQLAERDEIIKGFMLQHETRTIHDGVREAAVKSKIIDTAMEDVLMLAERMFEVGEDGKLTAKDGVGVTPGITPEQWLTEMTVKRPHWWPVSKGGGAGGGIGAGVGGDNPFSFEGWNMTAQGKLYGENPTRAAQLAQMAGTTVGGLRPPAPRK
jgi:hypothetical protein